MNTVAPLLVGELRPANTLIALIPLLYFVQKRQHLKEYIVNKFSSNNTNLCKNSQFWVEICLKSADIEVILYG